MLTQGWPPGSTSCPPTGERADCKECHPVAHINRRSQRFLIQHESPYPEVLCPATFLAVGWSRGPPLGSRSRERAARQQPFTPLSPLGLDAAKKLPRRPSPVHGEHEGSRWSLREGWPWGSQSKPEPGRSRSAVQPTPRAPGQAW